MRATKINVYAENRGWLFEDLKQHFLELNGQNDLVVSVSDQPELTADAWVALRTKEGAASPDLRRTVICVHDLFCEPGIYDYGGSRQSVRSAGGLVFSHPDQRTILSQAGISFERTRVLERPLGALSIFTPRQRETECFSVGWVGRNHSRKRLEWFIQAIQQLRQIPAELRISLIGRGLSEAAASLRESGLNCTLYEKQWHSIAQYPQLYQDLDCVVITSSTEAGPLPLFEALATGVPVVSTPVGWAPYFSQRAPRYVRLADSPDEITARLRQLRVEQQEMFKSRYEIAALVKGWSLETWLSLVLDLATSLVLVADKSFQQQWA
jgi:glycosyltransferase involved in cell wall biosynthesis